MPIKFTMLCKRWTGTGKIVDNQQADNQVNDSLNMSIHHIKVDNVNMEIEEHQEERKEEEE